jgi:hypothetical protein
VAQRPADRVVAHDSGEGGTANGGGDGSFDDGDVAKVLAGVETIAELNGSGPRGQNHRNWRRSSEVVSATAVGEPGDRGGGGEGAGRVAVVVA